MYRLSVPISIQILTEENRGAYHETFQKCGVDCVFLCCLDPLHKSKCILHTNPEHVRASIAYFKEKGYEVGVWVDGFGHGAALAHEMEDSDESVKFMQNEDIRGQVTEAICPLDKTYQASYCQALTKLAQMHPDIIMIDDDYRLGILKTKGMTCACPLHLKNFYREIGEDIPRDRLEKLILTGNGNRYRNAWMRVQGNSLLEFARVIRKAVDSVDPSIRMSICACFDTWDLDGTDCIEIAKTLAGGTAPYLRTIGKPYTSNRIADAVENTRMQAKWCRDAGVEVFSEGDVYPRPRFNIPARRLELFDLALIATNEIDGILKYMFDYNQPITYEMGYTERHARNADARREFEEIFASKKTTGVFVFEKLHKLADAVLPDEILDETAVDLAFFCNSRAQKILTENAIPTVYEPSDRFPCAVFGENARHIHPDLLRNGAILDSRAAEILAERGIDTGLLSADPTNPRGESFTQSAQTVLPLQGLAFRKLACKPTATVLSRYLPENEPASYLYENQDGQRFYVLGYDSYAIGHRKASCPNYFNNYYRNGQFPELIEWLCGSTLPATCTGHPFLYMIASEDAEKKSLSVALFNPFEDEAIAPTVKLAREYQSIRFLNCNGTLNGDTVTLTDIEPYGYAAFEVR